MDLAPEEEQEYRTRPLTIQVGPQAADQPVAAAAALGLVHPASDEEEEEGAAEAEIVSTAKSRVTYRAIAQRGPGLMVVVAAAAAALVVDLARVAPPVATRDLNGARATLRLAELAARQMMNGR